MNRAAQKAFEIALQNGELVQARWTAKGKEHRAPARVLDINDMSVVVVLEEASPPFERGEEVRVPRVGSRQWSVRNTVWSGLGEERQCQRVGCPNKVGPEEPERKQYCSLACRAAAHKVRVGKGQDIAGLVGKIGDDIKRVGDQGLTRKWNQLVKLLRKPSV